MTALPDDYDDAPPVSPNLDWTVYDAATGAVLRTGNAAPDDAALQASGDGEAVYLARLDARTEYLPDGVATARPTLSFDTLTIAADDTETATLELPGAFTALIDGVAYELEDTLEIASDMPATYSVVIRHFPYQDFAAEIVAE